MKILITNIYSYKNKGDATLVLETIRGLNIKYNNPEIVLSSDDTLDQRIYGNYKVIPSFNRLFLNKIKNDLQNNILNLLNCVRLIAVFKIEVFFFKINVRFNPFVGITLQKKLASYKESDIVFAVGGGYLLSNTKFRKLDEIIGRPALLVTCLEFYFAKAYNKPLILLHQSIGPFKDRRDTNLVIKYLKEADLIIVREDISYTLLKKFDLKKVLLRPDLAFSFNIPGISFFSQNEHASNEVKIGMTVRLCLDTDGQSRYEKELARFINQYLSKKTNSIVYFLPQVIYKDRNDDDTSVAKRISSIIDIDLQDRCVYIDTDFSPQDLKATIAECDFFIGTRMHSNIFALSSLVKTIAIAYEYKTTGIMQMVGLQKYTTTVEHITSEFLFESIEIIEKDFYYKENLKVKIDELIGDIWNFKLPFEL